MKRYLTTEEVAALLRCSKRTVQDAVAEGRLPHRRLSGCRRLLFDESEIIAALDGVELEIVPLARGGRIVRPKSLGKAEKTNPD